MNKNLPDLTEALLAIVCYHPNMSDPLMGPNEFLEQVLGKKSQAVMAKAIELKYAVIYSGELHLSSIGRRVLYNSVKHNIDPPC